MVSIWKYERDDLQNYLVLYLSSDYIINDFEMKMSSNLRNSFLLPIYDNHHEIVSEASTNKVDNNVDNVEITTNRVIKYPISNVILLSKYLENSHISFDVIMDIIESIVDIYYLCIDYLLLPEQVLFEMDKIFIDFRTNQVYMIYVPIENFGYRSDFKAFLINYLRKAMSLDGEYSKSYCDMLKYCDSGGFCLEGFKNMISYYKKEVKNMRTFHPDQDENGVDIRACDIEEYDEKMYEKGEDIVKKNLKSIFVKAGAIYAILFLSYVLAIRNAPVLFGDSFEITLLLSAMFLALAIYSYIKFIHCDILDFLEEKKRIKEVSPNPPKRNPPVVRRNIRKSEPLKCENVNRNRIMSSSARRLAERDMDERDEFFERGQRKRTIANREFVSREVFDDVTFDRGYVEDEYGVENKYCETELLQPQKRNYLINLITGEKIYLTKNMFKIGRYENENDYVLDDKTVGRFHAQIDIQREDVSITDLGSKNGTYINENRIYPYTKTFLNTGDIIKLAGVSLSFNK